MKSTPEHKQLLFDIFITAIEGGINYFANIDEYVWQDENGNDNLNDFYALISDNEGGDFHKLRIDSKVISKGLNKIVNNKVEINNRIKNTIKKAYKLKDQNDIDADGADCIVQAGLFESIVYG